MTTLYQKILARISDPVLHRIFRSVWGPTPFMADLDVDIEQWKTILKWCRCRFGGRNVAVGTPLWNTASKRVSSQWVGEWIGFATEEDLNEFLAAFPNIQSDTVWE